MGRYGSAFMLIFNDDKSVCLVLNIEKYFIKSDGKKEHKVTGWSLPGGSIRDNETPEQTAVREAREEAGVIVDKMVLVKKEESENPMKPPKYIFKALEWRYANGQGLTINYEPGPIKNVFDARWVDYETWQEGVINSFPIYTAALKQLRYTTPPT